MRLVTFEHGGKSSIGAWSGDRVVDLGPCLEAHAPGGTVETMVDLIRAYDDLEPAIRRWIASGEGNGYAIDRVRLRAPIARPPKNVICVGKNYREHIEEGDRASGQAGGVPAQPIYFTKPATSIIGPGDDIIRHRIVEALDYEVELAVVIGKRGRDVPVDEAMDYVFGYTIVNDVTARTLQRSRGQWHKGKGLDTFCPLGPCIVTRDEIPDWTSLEISLYVNDELRQRARTADMVFGIPTLIADLSAGMTLEPGDILATGTCAGCGFAFDPPRYLQPGDVVRCEISGIGTLTNTVREPA